MIPLKDNLSCKVFPWVTLTLIALNCVGFAIELMLPSGQMQQFLMKWTVMPSDFVHAFTSGNVAAMGVAMLTVVTASFLHGGWAHIIGNMIFLQAFSQSVEARMGSMNYVLFYIVSCFGAWGLHIFSDPSSMIPALGASGAIAGVMGAYLALYPRAEFKSIFFFSGWPVWAVIPAWSFLGVWGLVQMASGYGSIVDPANADSVAYWAHIGGFLVGGILAGVYALATPDTGICYVPISCDCTCNGPCTKKNLMHRFRFFRKKDWLAFVPKLHKEPCDHDHDHK